MTSQATPQFAKPRINALALLGLYDPADTTDWGPIRAAQLHAGRALALFLLAANLVAAAIVVMIAHDVVPRWQIIGWTTLIAGVSTAITLRRLDNRHRDILAAPLSSVRNTVWEGVALGLAWAVLPISVSIQAEVSVALGLWIVVSVLMAASAVALAALPLATISFLAVLGIAISYMLLAVTGPLLAGAAALFTALLVIGCFVNAKSLVVIRASEIAIAERDETVSLLLNDSEDKSADWLWEIDTSKRIVRASPRFAYAVGLDPVAINLQPFLQVLAGADWESGQFSVGLRQLAEKFKTREAFRDLLIPVRVKNEERWWELAASPRYDEKGGFIGFRGVGSDVTERRASADQLNRMARFDMLTGLPNRLLITESLARAIGDAEKWRSRCALMMIDLDRFKAVNDTLGHPAGDRLLGRVSERLGLLMSDHEMVGRLGGDEFAIVIRNAGDSAEVERFGARIIESLSAPYEVDGNTIYIGASVGVAYGPRDGKTTETLIRSSDLALDRSKAAGGGKCHIYEPQLHIDAEERRVLEIALRNALTRGELHLHFQPVVNAATQAVTGFETLLRWTSPEFGEVSPGRFIKVAEEARLISAIGDWALRAACAEAVRWPEPICLAVNVSPDQLHDPQFVSTVASALANSGLHPSRLELEVTESVFLHEGTAAMHVLERILDLGVNLSLDDFGTGYSSLGYLSRTRFSTIKIDRSFVVAAAKRAPEATAIIRAVVALANSLGMATTAEGVETEEEYRVIQELGCNKVQGYYFGRPLPVEEARAVALRSGVQIRRADAA